jgi:hypothetical protein
LLNGGKQFPVRVHHRISTGPAARPARVARHRAWSSLRGHRPPRHQAGRWREAWRQGSGALPCRRRRGWRGVAVACGDGLPSEEERPRASPRCPSPAGCCRPSPGGQSLAGGEGKPGRCRGSPCILCRCEVPRVKPVVSAAAPRRPLPLLRSKLLGTSGIDGSRSSSLAPAKGRRR